MPDEVPAGPPSEPPWLRWVQLLRLPAVFTAMADIFLGYLLVRSAVAESLPFPGAVFFALLSSSSCLYLSGMVLNDVFDRAIDAVQRPGRPIPSGRVTPRAAVVLGCVLMASGVACAAFAGTASLQVAAMLVLSVLAYDGLLKSTWLGPISMGLCRFLNVMLGASAVGSAALLWTVPQLQVATGLGIYVTGVTWFARREAEQNTRGPLIGAMIVINVGMTVLARFIVDWQPAEVNMSLALMLLAVTALVLNRRLASVVFEPTPARIQPAIRTLLLTLVVLDATLVLFVTGTPGYGLAVLALLVPTVVLSKAISVT